MLLAECERKVLARQVLIGNLLPGHRIIAAVTGVYQAITEVLIVLIAAGHNN